MRERKKEKQNLPHGATSTYSPTRCLVSRMVEYVGHPTSCMGSGKDQSLAESKRGHTRRTSAAGDLAWVRGTTRIGQRLGPVTGTIRTSLIECDIGVCCP